ncbi:class I SAM-dependent methyltransferase [Thermus scotoductus]|uniref:16S rRNA methyltransferase n=1 Tax=Thermus scotoductus TaxID=37636 RepID=A0A348XPZ0_THESC|nr:methyltransferase [Thermus scotoductus]RTG93878.1 16S rRNA methyltransferase [Thermus scotoductus]RTH01571.1 16S rRNA methyltransferase [Thermus scotoductus]RTH16694.1 16S rRNA methyltransferase [Thermus scotoductus]RTH97737.1 16S rRNA methyltransferase [Thermus scotoductus]RTI18904.1 16S rRNA methyltransferase [Thermus scotoductus]
MGLTLAEYHRLTPLPRPGGVLYVKPGARGYRDPVYEALQAAVAPFGQRALDLNPGVGLASLPLEGRMEVDRLETSRAAFRCLQSSGLKARLAPPWEAEENAYDLVVLALPAGRGTAYVEATLVSAARALRMGGRVYLAGDKNKGFERYFKEARALLGYGLVLKREGPVRVALLEKEREAPPLPSLWHPFQARLLGETFTFFHLPGVFSAGKVDKASVLLLEALVGEVGREGIRGRRILDLGAGYGALTLPLARLGGEVTALEDDLVSVLSLERSLKENRLAARVLHSDVDEALAEGGVGWGSRPAQDQAPGLTEEEAFDIIVTNPPFHVGGAVILDVAQAFVEAAAARLKPGGGFFLVANPFLKYEPLLEERFGAFRTLLVREYKVLFAEKARRG